MNQFKKIIFTLTFLFLLVGCTQTVDPLEITNGERIEIYVGEQVDLDYETSETVTGEAVWTSSSVSTIVDEEGIVTGRVQGESTITVTIGSYKDTIVIIVLPKEQEEVKIKLELSDSTIKVGEVTELIPTVYPSEYLDDVEYVVTSGIECITLEGNTITAVKAGAVVIHAKVNYFTSTSILLEIGIAHEHQFIDGVCECGEVDPNYVAHTHVYIDGMCSCGQKDPEYKEDYFEDPYVNVNIDEFYANYQPATSYLDSYYRTLHGLMSGSIEEQDQAPTISEVRPMENGMYIRNTSCLYSSDGNVYYVLNYKGEIVNKIYKGGAYVVLEEVAAYVFAFGDIPANHSASKKTKPSSSIWGEYLRVNHTKFSGDTSKYPYEPALPNISGIGGDLQYYEMDVGTTGTDCDPSYPVVPYNNGYSIERGAARIVYARFDKNGDLIIDPNERFVFYTYNHYNDFQEYLNYEGGWGEMFGNITGGGTISSKYDYNPTAYVPVVYKALGNSYIDVNYNQMDSEHIYVYLPIEDKKYIWC